MSHAESKICGHIKMFKMTNDHHGSKPVKIDLFIKGVALFHLERFIIFQSILFEF